MRLKELVIFQTTPNFGSGTNVVCKPDTLLNFPALGNCNITGFSEITLLSKWSDPTKNKVVYFQTCTTQGITYKWRNCTIYV